MATNYDEIRSVVKKAHNRSLKARTGVTDQVLPTILRWENAAPTSRRWQLGGGPTPGAAPSRNRPRPVTATGPAPDQRAGLEPLLTTDVGDGAEACTAVVLSQP